jgi:lysozyme family protein
MPVAPIVEREGELRSYGAPQQTYQRPIEGIGVGIENLGNVVDDHAKKAVERANEVKMIEAQRAFDDWEVTNLFDPKNGAFSKKGSAAFSVPEEVQKNYTDFVSSYKDTLANDDQKIAFDKMAASRWGSLAPRVQTHVREQMDSYSDGQKKATFDSAKNRAGLYWNDDKTVDDIVKNVTALAEKDGIDKGKSPEEIAADKAKAESQVRYSQLMILADRDPRRALDYADKHMASFSGDDFQNAQKLVSTVRENVDAEKLLNGISGGPITGQDNIIKFVMSDKIEGGDKVSIDSDGGTTKFGINHLHNKMTPEEVSNLTEEQALEKYKKDYWDTMGIGAMSPAMQIVAFDAAVNHGADDNTRKMIEEAKGDPMRLIDIRAQYYEKLARQDPEKNGPQLKGWMNRLAAVKAQVEAAQGEMPSLADAYAKIDASAGTDDSKQKAKALYKQRLDAVNESRKQAETEAARKVYEYESQGQTPPNSLIAQLSPEQKKARQEKAYDPIEYERVRKQVLYGYPVDLEQYRWRFAPEQYAILSDMQGKPDVQVQQRAIDKAAADNYSEITGKDSPTTKEDYERVGVYRRVLSGSVEAYEKLTGKRATPDDIKKLAKEVNVKPSGASMFVADGGEDQALVPGVPRAKGQYLFGGRPVEYGDLIAGLSNVAKNNNLPTNPTTLTIIFNDLVKQGKLADKYK